MANKPRATRRQFLVGGVRTAGLFALGSLGACGTSYWLDGKRQLPDPPDLMHPDSLSYSNDLSYVAASWFVGREFGDADFAQTRLYTLPEQKLIRTIPLPFPYGNGSDTVFTSWSSDNRRLAITMALWSPPLQIWEVNSGASISCLSDEKNLWLSALAWSPDGHRLLLGGQQRLIVLETPTGHRLFASELETTFSEILSGCAQCTWSPDGRAFAVLTRRAMNAPTEDWVVEIWDSLTYTRTNQLTFAAPSSFIAGVTFGAANLLWSPRGDRLALNLGAAIWVFEPTHQGEVPLFVDSSTNTTRGGPLAWSPDSTRLAQIAPLSVWDVENHRRLPTSFDNPNDSVGETLNYDALAWDANGKQVKAVSYSSSEVTWTVL